MARERARSALTPYEILAVTVFGDIAARLVDSLKVEESVVASGIGEHPVKLVSKALMNATMAAIYLTLVGLIAVPLIPFPFSALAAFAMAVTPVFVFLWPLLRVLLASSSRSARILEELPMLTIHLAILARAGLGVQQMVERVVNSGLYREVVRELARALSIAKVLGRDILHALDDVASHSPNRLYSDVLKGLVTAVRMRANPADFLSRMAETILSEYRLRLERLKQFAVTVGTIYGFMLIGMLFLNLLQTANIAPSFQLGIPPSVYGVLSLGAMPAATLLLALLLYRRVPKIGAETHELLAAFLTYLPVSGAVLAAAYLALSGLVGEGPAASLAITAGLAVPSVAGARAFARVAGREEELFERFVDFLHELATERRQGLPLEHIIDSMPYAFGPLNEVLKRLKMGVRLGLPPRAAIAQAFSGVRSRIVRFLANLLGDAIVLGAASEVALRQMEVLLAGLRDAVSSVRTELRSISVIPYILLVIEAVSIVAFYSMGTAVLTEAAQLSRIGVQPEQLEAQRLSMAYFMAGTTLTAWLGGLMVGVMRKQSIWAGFLHALALSAIISLAFLASTLLASGGGGAP